MPSNDGNAVNDLTNHNPSTSTYEIAVATEITRLIRLFDRRKISASEFAEIMADYVTVLNGLSLSSISEAVMRFSRGQVEWASKTFAPTPAELYTVANEIDEAQARREETFRRIEQRKALPAPEPPPRPTIEELKARFGEEWGIEAKAVKRWWKKATTPEEMEAARMRLQQLKEAPIEVSPTLASMFTRTEETAA